MVVNNMDYRPLADDIRPDTLDNVVGQQHILGENGVLRRIIESGNIPNMVFYGPSGTGKTTVANIIAKRTHRALHRLNATTAGISDIREVIADVDTLMAPNGVLLYLDEIQYFNKKQQQSLLEFMENGKITLIASTTENPYFYVFNAVLSRATVFEFKPVQASDIIPAIRRAVGILEQRSGCTAEIEDGVLEHLASACGGDVRKAINGVELLFSAAERTDNVVKISAEDAEVVAQRSAMRYDRDGDNHYDILSALQKSIRGSDPDAGLHYLARLLEAGDLISACRRIMVIASEDVGLAYPQAVTIVKSCVDAANMLGLPEARIPLAEAVVLLATAPKSNSAICGIDAAMEDVRRGKAADIPAHLMDSHYAGSKKLGHGLTYRYPHSFPHHYVPQQYLPDALVGKKYYEYGDNKIEQAAKAYWDAIKGK
jgi:putative ATPase